MTNRDRNLSKWDPRLWWDLIGQGNSPMTVLRAGLRGFSGMPA